MKKILIAILAAVSLTANAQYMGTVPPNVDVRFNYSEDTDHFRAVTTWAGAAHESGFGARLGYSRYESPTTSANSEFGQITYMNLGENHSFQGAIGSRGVGSNDYLIADAELKLTMTDSLTLGLSVATDVVESANSLQTGTSYVYVAGDMDLLLDENLNLNVIVGNIHFTDDNDRQFIKSKLTWTFIPEYGVSTYLRLKAQQDSRAGGTNYYSPENLTQEALGLQIRKPYTGLVYTAAVEYGYEQATLFGYSSNNPIYLWTLGVQTSPGRKTGLTYGVSLTGSNTSFRDGASSAYNWYGLTSWIKVPLQ